jgi:hypothetical protein
MNEEGKMKSEETMAARLRLGFFVPPASGCLFPG